MWQPLAEMYPDADLTTYSGRCDLAVQLLDEAVLRAMIPPPP